TSNFVTINGSDFINECLTRIEDGQGGIGVLSNDRLEGIKNNFREKKAAIIQLETLLSGSEDTLFVDSVNLLLAGLKTDFTVSGFNIAKHYLRDTLFDESAIDSVIKYLNDLGNYESHRMLAFLHLFSDNEEEYNGTLANIQAS